MSNSRASTSSLLSSVGAAVPELADVIVVRTSHYCIEYYVGDKAMGKEYGMGICLLYGYISVVSVLHVIQTGQGVHPFHV